MKAAAPPINLMPQGDNLAARGNRLRVPSNGFRRRQAFSLVELLVVIAVIGVLAGIAITTILNIHSAAQTAKDQRNARMISSLATAARGAGFSIPWGSKSNAISMLGAGISVANPADPSMVFSFRVDTMPLSEQEAACRYLLLSGSNLSYVPEGGQTD